jgi:hypothetical protein
MDAHTSGNVETGLAVGVYKGEVNRPFPIAPVFFIVADDAALCAPKIVGVGDEREERELRRDVEEVAVADDGAELISGRLQTCAHNDDLGFISKEGNGGGVAGGGGGGGDTAV